MVFRFFFFLALWLILDGAKFVGLIIGIPAAGLTSWLSVRLYPPVPSRFCIIPALSLLWFFLRHSIVAGVDVAWRALHPRLPLCPGFVEVECDIPKGVQRDVHLAMCSLLPGSLPVENKENQSVVLHCLDTRQPVATLMKQQEKLLQRMRGEASHA